LIKRYVRLSLNRLALIPGDKPPQPSAIREAQNGEAFLSDVERPQWRLPRMISGKEGSPSILLWPFRNFIRTWRDKSPHL